MGQRVFMRFYAADEERLRRARETEDSGEPAHYEMQTRDSPDDEIRRFRGMIQRAFPPDVYFGPITNVDGHPEPELEEEQALYAGLKGKSWTQVAPATLSQNPGGAVLLTVEAFAAFLPAWLTRSLDKIVGENPIRDLLIYSFVETEPPNDHMLRRLHSLTRDQRLVLRDIMQYFMSAEPDPFVRAQARGAVHFIESASGP